jgi:hypothetical protein
MLMRGFFAVHQRLVAERYGGERLVVGASADPRHPLLTDQRA